MTGKENKMEHKRNPAVNKVWKVLRIFENVQDNNHPATMYDFKVYLQRTCVQYKGAGDTELYELINGLLMMAEEDKLSHNLVRNIVFHCIDIITKRG